MKNSENKRPQTPEEKKFQQANYTKFRDLERKDAGPSAAAPKQKPAKKGKAKTRAVVLPQALATGLLDRVRTHDGAAAGSSPADAAHVGWLAQALLSEIKRTDHRAKISAELRLELIQHLSR